MHKGYYHNASIYTVHLNRVFIYQTVADTVRLITATLRPPHHSPLWTAGLGDRGQPILHTRVNVYKFWGTFPEEFFEIRLPHLVEIIKAAMELLDVRLPGKEE